MMAPTHVMIGVAAYTAASITHPATLPISALTIAAASLGSLAPDLDHPNSWLGKRLFFISVPLSAVLGHRGLTHSLVAAVAATAGLGWYLKMGELVPWMVAFLIGYLLHLVADWNTGGVPIFWPSPRKYKAPWAFPTGGILERLFAIGLACALAYSGWIVFKGIDLGGLL